MTSISKLMTSLEKNSEEFPVLLHDLMVNNNDLPFDNHEINAIWNSIIRIINSYMNQTQYRGLIILYNILSICPNDVLLQHGLFWINKSIEMLRNIHSMEELILICKVLGSLIICCKDVPELKKHISMHNVKEIINILNALQTDEKCGAVYYLIAVLLYHYPEVCERFQELIKGMIFLQIDSTQTNLVNASANCYLLLSKATERSLKSLSNHTGWIYNELLLCKTLHIIMDELYPEQLNLDIDIQDKLELPAISNSNVIKYYYGQQQRFSNLCVYLSSMLRGYEAENSVLPNHILHLLCRGLAITPLNIKYKVSAKELLYLILPKLHISLLTVLDAFINGFQQELIPFGGTILQLFEQTLQWTNTVLSEHTTLDSGKSFRKVRTYAYKCLSSWLTHTGSMSGIETITNECVTSILKDIIPERDCISLNMPQEKSHHKSKRVKRNHINLLNTMQISTKHNLDAVLSKEALITLQNIVFSGGVLLKETFYINVHDAIKNLLYDFYLGVPQSFYKDHKDCRLQLFKVLKALQMNPHVKLVLRIQDYLDISQMAAHDIDSRIVQEAKLALTELEKIVHPIGPTLQLPRQEHISSTYREPNNEYVPNNQAEGIATVSTSDKRKIEEEPSQNTDAISLVSKRPRIISLQYITKNINKIHNVTDTDKSQINENLDCEDIENLPQKQDEIHRYERHEHIDESTNAIDSVMECERECDNSATEEQKEDTEQEKKEQELNTGQEEQEQPENLLSCTDKTSIVENVSPNIAKKIQWEILQNHPIGSEQLNADTLESISLFHSEV